MEVKLKNIKETHLKELYNWELDEEIQRETGIEEPRTYEAFLKSYALYFSGKKPKLYLKAIEIDNIVIGRIELFKTHEEYYLGIVIGNKEYQNKGIGSRAFKLFIDDIKINKGVSKLTAEVYEDNLQSLNFFLKNDFIKTSHITVEKYRGMDRHLIILERKI